MRKVDTVVSQARDETRVKWMKRTNKWADIKKRRDIKKRGYKGLYYERPCTPTHDSFYWMWNVSHSYRMHFVIYFNDPHRSNGSVRFGLVQQCKSSATLAFYFINLKYDIYYIALLMIKLKIAWRRTYVVLRACETMPCHPWNSLQHDDTVPLQLLLLWTSFFAESMKKYLTNCAAIANVFIVLTWVLWRIQLKPRGIFSPSHIHCRFRQFKWGDTNATIFLLWCHQVSPHWSPLLS